MTINIKHVITKLLRIVEQMCFNSMAVKVNHFKANLPLHSHFFRSVLLRHSARMNQRPLLKAKSVSDRRQNPVFKQFLKSYRFKKLFIHVSTKGFFPVLVQFFSYFIVCLVFYYYTY